MAVFVNSNKSHVTNNATSTIAMPVLPVGGRSVRIHTILDHSILGAHLLLPADSFICCSLPEKVCFAETIINNRTAMVTNSINTHSRAETDVILFGTTPASAKTGAGGATRGASTRTRLDSAGEGLRGTMTTWFLAIANNNTSPPRPPPV